MQLVSMAVRSLYNNRLRTFLSSLGIVIGVSTIVLVFAIGTGAQVAIEEQYANLAVTSILVNPVSSASQKSKLSDADVAELASKCPNVRSVTSLMQGKLLSSWTGDPVSLTVLGAGEGFLEISKLSVRYGTYWDADSDGNRAVLWDGAAIELFGSAEGAVGKTVRIGKKKYEVSGIFWKSGTAIGPITYDDSVFIPMESANSLIGDSGNVRIVALAKDVESIPSAISEIGLVLREAHKLKTSQSDDFRVVDQGSKVTAAQESARTMTVLLTWVATIVLVVSGIGIMNVMFAGVAERTKEIGILKSIGIRTEDILTIFLLESVILSVSGGVIGILLWDTLIPVIRHFDLIDAIPSMVGRLGAFLFAVFVGAFFGYYPAYRASKMDPVDALRA